jgi:hypothetical protein
MSNDEEMDEWEEMYQEQKYLYWMDVVQLNCRELFIALKRIMKNCSSSKRWKLEKKLGDFIDWVTTYDVDCFISADDHERATLPWTFLGRRFITGAHVHRYSEIHLDVTDEMFRLAKDIAGFLEDNCEVHDGELENLTIESMKRIVTRFSLSFLSVEDRDDIEDMREITCTLIRRCKNAGIKMPQVSVDSLKEIKG